MKNPELHGNDLDELFVNYLEGELKEEELIEAQLLLDHSELNQKIVKNLQRTKDLVSQNDPTDPLVASVDFDALHDSIMARVEMAEETQGEESLEVAKASFSSKPGNNQMGSILGGAVLVMMMLGLVWWSQLHHQHQMPTLESSLANQDLHSPSTQKPLLSYKSDIDFLLESSAQGLEALPEESSKELINDFLND